MQHASSISMEDTEEEPFKAIPYPFANAEEEVKPSALEPVKQGVRFLWRGLVAILSCFTPSNIKNQYAALRKKTYFELFLGFFKLSFYSFFYSIWSVYFVCKTVVKFIVYLMTGGSMEKTIEEEEKKVAALVPKPLPLAMVPMGIPLPIEGLPMDDLALLGEPMEIAPIKAFGLDIKREEDGGEVRFHVTPSQNPQMTPQSSLELSDPELGSEEEGKGSPTEKMADGEVQADGVAPVMQENHVADGAVKSKEMVVAPQMVLSPEMGQVGIPMTSEEAAMAMMQARMAMAEAEQMAKPVEAPPMASIDLSEYTQRIVSFLARNFYNMKYVALVMAFCINFILLFYKVTSSTESDDDDDESKSDLIEDVVEMVSNVTEEIVEAVEEAVESILNGEAGEDEEDAEEWVVIEDKFFYLEPIIRLLAALHSLASFCMLIAYYHLKVPLAIFKREKEIARKLEFEGLYISEEAAEDDVKSHWDKLVISTRSFPVNYWDKFVKKRVREKYSETYDHDAISNLLGMDKSGSFTQEEESTGYFSLITRMDWKYQVWKSGVTITDNSFLYNLWYFVFSVMGNFNYFFFAAHLLDIAVGFKTLRTILQSVTHNGKQLVLTVMLLTIIVYIYTVIAFNFFRKFYVQEEDDQVDQKCHNMLTCFVFHLYKGVRAGGGIGDEIDPPDGDEYEVYRIVFDITFFFFVIVILLAIIQGLIIDAFGELRDQLQSVVEDMESNCFICGIGKDYFDKVPHGFDTHVQKEHNLANYMFFLMHLINKPDTEYTGQETYVWELYQKRCWDFFPVGDCFRKQYEDELVGTS